MRDELKSLRQESRQPPDLEGLRDRYLSKLGLGKQAPGYKTAQKIINQFISEVRSQLS